MEISQSPNILNWYPFNKNQAILEIGDNSIELTKTLKDKAKKLVKIDKLEQIKEIKEIKEKFDIVTLIGINEHENIHLKETIAKIEPLLENEGKILLAVDNKFGLKFFSGNPEKILGKKFQSLIGYSNEPTKIETYTKSSLENMLEELGYNTRFYYPLPDYKIPNVIFTDSELPRYNSIDKYNQYFTENSTIIFNEIDVFREILKTDRNMFPFFANSFLVEITKGKCDETYKYISFNNMRKDRYRLITKIADQYVEKQMVDEKAKKHYENIKDNISFLQDKGVNLVDYLAGDIIRSSYVEQKYLLSNVLLENLEKGDIEEFRYIMNSYIDKISIDTYKETDYAKTVFGKFQIEVENKDIINDLHFMKNGLWDMTFKNCFYVDEKLYFFDQEWNEPNLPVEYILYRSIFYTISLRRFIKIEDLFEKYNLTKYLQLFKQLDDKLQVQVRDDKIWAFYSENHDFDIDGTKQELINQCIRNEAQEQEIKNLNIRSEAQKAEADNLKIENQQLKENNANLQTNLNSIQIDLKNDLFYKIKRKLKKRN